MRIVLDTNVVFGALLRDGLTRRLIVQAPFPLLFPEGLMGELRAHRDRLIERSGLSPEVLRALLDRLARNMELVPTERLAPHLARARRIVAPIDPDDVLFVAACLACEPAILWSEDRRLRRQSEVLVLTTSEMRRFFSMLSRSRQSG